MRNKYKFGVLALTVSVLPLFGAHAASESVAAYAQRMVKHGLPKFELEPDLDKMIDTANTGELVVDTDPVCQCQDDDGQPYRIVSVKGTNDMADVAISHDSDRYTLVLHRINGQWKVHDVIDSDGSLRNYLTGYLKHRH
jgi:hypothetical protein